MSPSFLKKICPFLFGGGSGQIPLMGVDRVDIDVFENIQPADRPDFFGVSGDYGADYDFSVYEVMEVWIDLFKRIQSSPTSNWIFSTTRSKTDFDAFSINLMSLTIQSRFFM